MGTKPTKRSRLGGVRGSSSAPENPEVVGTGEEGDASWSLVRVSEMSWKEGSTFRILCMEEI